ncbi:MAG: DMT family transporter, partial [Candidatus Kapabacteria bacterium]|nr:DMT family transporter [Candidatus Kapabacteria bacterium]
MQIYILFVIQQLIASSTHIFAKNVVMTMHPVNVVFYRGAFSVLLYGAWLWWQKTDTTPIARADWKRYLWLGLVNMPLNQLMFVWGLRYTTPANASLAYALSPAFVALLGALFFGERLGKNMLLGICIAFAGTSIVLFEKGIATSPEYLLGNAIELCASLSWSLYTVLGRSLSLQYGAIRTTGISMLTGFAMFAVVTLLAP